MLCVMYYCLLMYCFVNNHALLKIMSLQARPYVKDLPKKKRASRFGSCEGSVTVEAAFVFPVFLCGICCLIGIGQMLFTETQIQYAVSQTAKTCAREQSVESTGGRVENRAGDLFFSGLDQTSLCEDLIEGGIHGIQISSQTAQETVEVKASYVLKTSMPFFSRFRFSKTNGISRRIFSGYVPHAGEGEEDGGDPIVYVAENGVVYHTNPSCSHICLTITGSAEIRNIMTGSSYDACEKCIKKGQIPGQLYITASGDCYHSSLSCSGLKRTIMKKRVSEISGMHLCSRCAGKK